MKGHADDGLKSVKTTPETTGYKRETASCVARSFFDKHLHFSIIHLLLAPSRRAHVSFLSLSFSRLLLFFYFLFNSTSLPYIDETIYRNISYLYFKRDVYIYIYIMMDEGVALAYHMMRHHQEQRKTIKKRETVE